MLYSVNLKDWMVIRMSNPFIFRPAGSDKIDTAEEFCEYAYDFKKNCFLYDREGRQIIFRRNEAIKVWAYKALLTERFLHLAYFDDYGAELEHFIGRVPNDGSEASKLFNYIEDTLLVNPYIVSVENVDVAQDHKKITLNIGLTTVYGKYTLGIEV